MKDSVRTGLFVFLALVVFAVVVSVVEDVPFFKKGHLFTVYFERVMGLDVGSRISMSGVNVGRVEKMEIQDGRVKVVMRLQDGLPLKEDSKALVKMLSIMGNAEINLTFGTRESPPLKGDVMQGAMGTDFQEIMDSAQVALSRAGETFAEVRKLVADLSQTQQNLSSRFEELVAKYDGKAEGIVDNLAATTESIRQVSERLTAIAVHVQNGEGTVGKLLMSDELHSQVVAVTQKAQELEESLKTILSENREDIGKLVDQGNVAAERMTAAINSINEILDKVKAGEGTVGKLVTDEAIYDQAKSGLAEARDYFSKAKQLKIYLGVAGIADTEIGGMDGFGYVRLEPTENKYYLIGARNLYALANDEDEEEDRDGDGEEDEAEFDVEIAHRFCSYWTVRGGMLRSSPGIALDYDIPPLKNPKLSVELYDFEEDELPSLDFQVRWDAWKWFYLYGETRDVLDEAEFAGGLGFEFRDEDLKYLISIVGSAGG